ncbi:MAG: hypothetical protein JXO51_11305 [Candidatus Aminicenantes bacterium]|nr:hypothetical protein [Candidatus Aminicenantes bacterium]
MKDMPKNQPDRGVIPKAALLFFGARFAVYMAGVLPWFVLHGTYNMAAHGHTPLNLMLLIAPVVVYASLEALVSLPLQRKVRLFRRLPIQQVKLRHFLVTGAGIVLVYVAALLVNRFFSGTPQ